MTKPYSSAEIEQQQIDAYHDTQSHVWIPRTNLNGLISLEGIDLELGLVSPTNAESAHQSNNLARPRAGYDPRDAKVTKTSIVSNGFNPRLTIPVVVEVGTNLFRKLNGWTRFAIYGPEDLNIDNVLVWKIPDVVSHRDEMILSARLNPQLPVQSPVTKKDIVLLANELMKADMLEDSESAISDFVDSIVENPDNVNYNVRQPSWVQQTKNSIMRETGTGMFRYPAYQNDEKANSHYKEHQTSFPYLKGKVAKVHGIRAKKYLKPRTNHIIVRLNGCDDHHMATMDSLAMRRNSERRLRGMSELVTHCHIDIDVTATTRSISEQRENAKAYIERFVRLMKDRGCTKFYWVVDGFYKKEEHEAPFIEWNYNPNTSK